jgi:hypothetical protein
MNDRTKTEDWRVTTARNALAASAQKTVSAPDFNPFYWLGRLESVGLMLLDVIDEGTHEARTPDLSTLPRAELIRHILFHCDEARSGVDVLKEREDA